MRAFAPPEEVVAADIEAAVAADAAVELRGVTKRYGDAPPAVAGLDLALGRGEFFTLLGPSGCGKTTTLRLVAGFEAPTEGHVLIGGRDVTDVPAHERPVHTVFQSYALFPHLDVAENVAFPLRVRRVGARERRRRVAEALALVRMEGFEARRPSGLSGGQQQRVALARALVDRPEVLLLDEPLGALDLHLRRAMQGELKAMQRALGLTFVFVTHDQEEALAMSDRIALMRDGRVVQLDAPARLYDRPLTRFAAEFIGETNLLPARVERLEGGRAIVSLAGASVALPAPEGLGPGEAVLAIRPEAVRMGGPAEGEAVELPARLREVVFLGADRRLVFEAERATVAALARNDPAAPPPEPGSEALLRLPAADLRLLAP